MKQWLLCCALCYGTLSYAQVWRKPPYNAQLIFDVPDAPKLTAKSDTVYQYYKNKELQEFMLQWVLVKDALAQLTVFFLKDGDGDDYKIRGIGRVAIAVSNPFTYVYEPNNPENKREAVNTAIQLFRKEGQQ